MFHVKQLYIMSKTKTKTDKPQFYSLSNILKQNADYNIIFGERSNGKTFAVLEYALKNYIQHGTQTAYIRRWREDLRGKRAETLFAGHVQTGLIEKLSGGKFNNVVYNSGKWYLSNSNEKDEKPFCYAFALSETEHDKSTSYPQICTIIFDEFLTRRYYLPDEFILFTNTLSTIIRQRDNVKIFMLGNTVNKYCPYFAEMGLKNIPTQQQGTIDIYKFGNEGLTVAVEYTASMEKSKASNKYFAFDNQNLQMITAGKWEVSLYPHLPTKYLPRDVIFVYYIIFNETILQANIINDGVHDFTYIHPKTTPIKNPDECLIYTLESKGKPNYKRKLLSALSDIESKITKYFANDKVFYSSNEVGEIVRNYIKVSSVNNLLK